MTNWQSQHSLNLGINSWLSAYDCLSNAFKVDPVLSRSSMLVIVIQATSCLGLYYTSVISIHVQ